VRLLFQTRTPAEPVVPGDPNIQALGAAAVVREVDHSTTPAIASAADHIDAN
jgi:hypothetical protein